MQRPWGLRAPSPATTFGQGRLAADPALGTASCASARRRRLRHGSAVMLRWYEQRIDLAHCRPSRPAVLVHLIDAWHGRALEARPFAKYLAGDVTSAIGELDDLVRVRRFGSDDDRGESGSGLALTRTSWLSQFGGDQLGETQVNQQWLAKPWGHALSAAPSLLEAVQRRPATACDRDDPARRRRHWAIGIRAADRMTMPPRRAQAAPRPDGVADAQAVVGASASAARRGGACVGSARPPPFMTFHVEPKRAGMPGAEAAMPIRAARSARDRRP